MLLACFGQRQLVLLAGPGVASIGLETIFDLAVCNLLYTVF